MISYPSDYEAGTYSLGFPLRKRAFFHCICQGLEILDRDLIEHPLEEKMISETWDLFGHLPESQ